MAGQSLPSVNIRPKSEKRKAKSEKRKAKSEKRKALSALRGVRVVANGKFADAGDTAFKVWSLELLSTDQVTAVLGRARPGESRPSDSVIDLLRLPLLLSIYVLSPAHASGTGELLRQFHEYLSRDLPEGFTDLLARSAAKSALANERSYGRFVSHMQAQAEVSGVAEPVKLVQKLGTVDQRGGQLLPIHDLYWSWLVGRGLLSGQMTAQAIQPLHTRDSYALALQSGAFAEDEDVRVAVADDLVLAATLQASRRSKTIVPALGASLDSKLGDNRLAVRNRAGLAALETEKPEYLRLALDVLSELSEAKLYVADWLPALRPPVLFQQRAIVADWVGSPGSDFVLDAIAERGGPEWCPWLEQMALSGKIAIVDALATALACNPEIRPTKLWPN
jgi:hypothetical protein